MPRSSSLDPYISDHFPLLTSNKRKEEALRPRLIIHLVTSLPGPGIGRNGNLEMRRQALLSHLFSKQCQLQNHVWGGTWEGGSCEEKNADSAGNRGSPLNGCLGEEGRADEKASPHHPVCHPRVRSCCQNASLHGTIGGKRWGEAMRECGVRGRDDLLLQRTLSEFQETFKSQYETELFIKHPLGVRKILKSYFFKNN